MPILRRFIALLLASIFCLSALAQTTPETELIGEKITLDDAIHRALEKNFSLKVSRFNTSIAAARVTEAFGKFDPVINGSYAYSASFSPALTNDATGIRPAPAFDKADSADLSLGGLMPWGMSYEFGVNLTNSRGTDNLFADNYYTFAGISGTQPLLRNFGFGPTLATVCIVQVNHNISQWQFRQSLIDTITGVIFAYHDLNLANASLRSAIRSKELAIQLLEENRKRFKIGNISAYDVISAESRVATRDENILLTRRLVREAENALKQLITDDKTPALLSWRITIEPPPPAPIVVVDAASDSRIALRKRPDFQQARLALQRDSINTQLQRNQLLPRVDLVGSYGYSGYDTDLKVSRQQVTNEDYRAYSWGVLVSAPLSFTTERGRYRSAKLQQRQSETELERIEQDIVVRVGATAGQIEIAQKRVQSTRRARELAQYTLDAEVKRFRAGQIGSTTFQVAQQQEIVSNSEVSEARAQADYAKAIAEYDRQLGVTLEKLNFAVVSQK
jgi:outer membrane protein TolC